MKDSFFPIFVNLKNKEILIIGGGKIAYRKIKNIIDYPCKITVITKEIREKKILDFSNINIIIGDFKNEYLNNKFMVIVATDDKNFNNYIVQLCNEKNILVNNITSKNNMTFRVPAIFENSEFIIGISAFGNPKKSKSLKEKFKNFDLN